MQSYPWLRHYTSSIPYTIQPECYESIVTLLEDAFAKYGSLPMCENMGTLLTYHQVDKLSKAFAAYLQNYTPLQVGHRIAIQLPNLLQYPVALLGILRAGMVVVNINPQYTPYEMEHQLRDAGAKAIIILENFAHQLVQVLPKLAIQTVIITQVGDLLGSFKGRFVNFCIKYFKKLIPPYRLPHAICLKTVLQKGKKLSFHPVRLTGDNIAFLQYTGGTTGVAKGAVLTHRNIIAVLEQMKPLLFLRGLKEQEEIAITPLPLYHIFALTSLLIMLKIGGKCILITNPRDLKHVISTLRKHPFTFMIGVHTLFDKLLAHRLFPTLDFSHLKLTIAGGMATSKEVIEKWKKITGSPLLEGYGLTETTAGVACNLIQGMHYVPISSTAVKIVDHQYNEVAYGVPGELLVKGPQVMKEYWQRPQETAQSFFQGWLKTGDIAIMYTDGSIEIVDRKKDMINVSGFNVYPNEIENAVIGHPKVLEVGAVGMIDINLKEVIKLFVVKKDVTLNAEELFNYCKERLTKYKLPKYIEFRDSLPKSNVGKVLRRVLKEEEKRNSLTNKKPTDVETV